MKRNTLGVTLLQGIIIAHIDKLYEPREQVLKPKKGRVRGNLFSRPFHGVRNSDPLSNWLPA